MRSTVTLDNPVQEMRDEVGRDDGAEEGEREKVSIVMVIALDREKLDKWNRTGMEHGAHAEEGAEGDESGDENEWYTVEGWDKT